MALAMFTLVHVVLSLVGIAAGFVVLSELLRGREHVGWTRVFLVTTIATSVTGFGFPVDRLLPSHVVGMISLAVLAVAVVARRAQLRGAWRRTYAAAVGVALYLNVLVAVVQAFTRVSVLHALAPQQTEPPFVIAQLVVLACFVVLTTMAARRFARAAVA